MEVQREKILKNNKEILSDLLDCVKQVYFYMIRVLERNKNEKGVNKRQKINQLKFFLSINKQYLQIYFVSRINNKEVMFRRRVKLNCLIGR